MQIHGLTLEFEVHASKRRLRCKKKQYATCALDSTSPKEGEGVGEGPGRAEGARGELHVGACRTCVLCGEVGMARTSGGDDALDSVVRLKQTTP